MNPVSHSIFGNLSYQLDFQRNAYFTCKFAERKTRDSSGPATENFMNPVHSGGGRMVQQLAQPTEDALPL